MRRATSDTQWLIEDGVLQGLALGYDFCAEHEASTPRLKAWFGISDKTPCGLDDRLIQGLSPNLIYGSYVRVPRDKRRSKQNCAILACPDYPTTAEKLLAQREVDFYSDPGESWHTPKHDLVCAWSESDFAIIARGEQNLAYLQELHAAFQAHDILFGAGLAGGWAAHRGLTFVLNSRVSAESRQSVLDADRDYLALLAAASAIGIEARLRAAKRGFYALAPAWANEEKSAVRFFLNPCEQSRFNFGWFTAEELDAWIANTGPIVKSALAA